MYAYKRIIGGKKLDNRIFTSYVENFIKENQNKMYRIAYSYVKNKDDALDIVHDAVVKMLTNISTLKNTEYLETWFYRILINEALMYIRKNKRLCDIYEGSIEFITADSNSTESAKEEYIDLYNAMDKLEPKYKTIIILKYFEDLKFKEIAQILRINENTAKSRLYKAIHKLEIELK